jgi:hypothetical protein
MYRDRVDRAGLKFMRYLGLERGKISFLIGNEIRHQKDSQVFLFRCLYCRTGVSIPYLVNVRHISFHNTIS